MTTPTPTEPTTDQDPEQPAPDGLLHLVAAIANGSDLELGLTLNVRGVTVTGTLCSVSTYLHGVATKISQESRDDAGWFPEVLTDLAEQSKPPWLARKEAGLPTDLDEVIQPSHLIHLRDARFYAGGVLTPDEGTFWRGRLDSVDGFVFGKMAEGYA
jgi:hypothetical protein